MFISFKACHTVSSIVQRHCHVNTQMQTVNKDHSKIITMHTVNEKTRGQIQDSNPPRVEEMKTTVRKN